MPPVGVNILQNPDFSESAEGFFGPEPLYWVTQATWDPNLAWGCAMDTDTGIFETPGGLTYLGPNDLRVDWGASTQLDPDVLGYAGLLYAGGGFDAAPGDSWRIKFDGIRRKFPSFFRIAGLSLGLTSDLFVRVGITVPDEFGGGWTSYSMSLPAASLAISDGATVAYDETFEIPSNWPEGVYQFAIVTTGDPDLPALHDSTTYQWGLRVDFSNPSLSFQSSGAGSSGPAGVPHPVDHWPTIDFVSSECAFPKCCGYLEWTPWELSAPLTTDVFVGGTLPETGASGATVAGRSCTLIDAAEAADGWPGLPSFVPPGAFNAGARVDLSCPESETACTDVFQPWVACGDWCVFLFFESFIVPIREYEWALAPITHIPEWLSTRSCLAKLCHPSALAGLVDTATLYPYDPRGRFCFTNNCGPQPPGPPPPEAVYLTHEVAPGDANIPAGGTGGLNLRGARVAP